MSYDDIRSMMSDKDSTTGHEGKDRQRDDVLARIRSLLSAAEGYGPEEAENARRLAERMMARYRVEMHELGEQHQDNVPIAEDKDISWYWETDEETATALWSMFSNVARHCNVQIVTWTRRFHGIPCVGLPNDIAYFDMLFTSMSVELALGLEPKPRPGEPMIEYLVRAKEAGMKWERIGALMLEYGIADFPEYKRNVGVRFTKLYTDHCTAHNRPRLRVQPGVYQRSFKLGFAAEMRDRLIRLRDETTRGSMTTEQAEGYGLVLADTWTRVNHKALELYPKPEMKPVKVDPNAKPPRIRKGPPPKKIDMGAVADGRRKANEVDLSGGKKVSTGRGSLPA